MYHHIATAIYKRATDDGIAVVRPPGWAWGILLLDLILFFPVFLVIGYTLGGIFPVLAMIEDPSPPAYEPVSLNDDSQSIAEENANVADEAARGIQDTRATTSSLRATFRAVYAVSGWKSLFRGFGCFFTLNLATGFVQGIIGPRFGLFTNILGGFITVLALIQLYTAWLHIVISTPSPKYFWQRLPPFKQAFSAAALPTFIYFLAMSIQQYVPIALAGLLHLTLWDLDHPDGVPQPRYGDSWKVLLVLLSSLALNVFLVIPAHVVLARVQASLLPEEDETIVPFDRSFQGKVEPAIVGGRGYVSPLDAWKTFSRASWVRLVKLYVKIFAVTMAISFLLFAVLVPEMILIVRSTKVDN